jgi:lytic murein transglycosylase
MQAMLRVLIGSVVAACLAMPATAGDRESVERDFRAWIDGPLRQAATAHGISAPTLDAALADTRLDWSVPDLRPPGSPEVAQDWRQSEFRAPSRYFGEGNIAALVELARARLDRHAGVLGRIEAETGVPREIVVAIWGRESAFGRAGIPHDAISVLATHAFMGRRREMFARELLAALEMLERGEVTRHGLRSSWAGALGQPQFLPTKYLAFAADGDGDGRRDIWNSVPDTLASIARFLKENGWQSGRDWGFEAVVPETVSCALEGPDRGMAIDQWVRLGVTRVAGRHFAESERQRTGYLMMPAGRHGPAFIATENFYVLKAYNESDLYALFIGHLADRMRGGGPFVAGWRDVSGFGRTGVHALQVRLEELGYDVGGTDGLIGYRTRRSVGDFQARSGLTQTCFPDAGLITQAR